MSPPILATKLFIPPPRSQVVRRSRLLQRLNEGLGDNHRAGRKLTLISAAAGFGKTTLVSEWVASCQRATAWLSLDEGDNDPARFLAYLVAALQTLVPMIGEGVLAMLQSPQPPPTESMLTILLNEITAVSTPFILVLDDYHAISTPPVDHALAFLIEHQPPQMHVVIATRENPPLPLARYRVRGQLTELRVADLRFTTDEAAGFLNQVMGLGLSAEDIATLEARTEGWIAGLQLAALSLQRQQDTTRFIESFAGTHHFVLDYLLEEVLHQQSENVQAFLLQTSILDRMCGSLCDALLSDPPISGQEMLTKLERANLFIIPLDNERHWYRYHHLFADLLRQRLQQRDAETIAELHGRASIWYETQEMVLEAFHHATAAGDVERAARLIEGKGMPLYFRGALLPVMNWLASLPTAVLDARPSLWVTYGSVLTMSGQPVSHAEEKLQAAEAALKKVEPDDTTRDLIGQIAANRAMLAIPHNDVETIIAQSQRALAYLDPDNLPARTNATWTLGLAHQFHRNHAAAIPAFTEAIAISQSFGNNLVTLAAATCLGQVQEAEARLDLAAQSYQLCLQTAGDPPWVSACEAVLGYGRVHYQWNDLDAAERYAQLGSHLSQQMESVDTPAACWTFLARLKLAQGDVTEAVALVAKAEQFMHQRNFLLRLPDLVAVQILILLNQGDLDTAVHLLESHDLPLSKARVHLAQGDTTLALDVLESFRQQMESNHWPDELLKVMVLQAVVYEMHGERDTAVQILSDALALAEPGGFIRIFVDEGQPMAELLTKMKRESGRMTGYAHKVLTAFDQQNEIHPSSLTPSKSSGQVAQPLVEPLSVRELEVLQLIAQGLSNREIGERLFLEIGETGSLDAVRFFRQEAGAKTLLAAGQPGLVAVNPNLRLKIKRTKTGVWEVEAAAGNGNSEPQFSVTDAAFGGGANRFFGFQCTYTSSNVSNFFFDDISVLPDVPDTQPPFLLMAAAEDSTTVKAVFDEELDSLSAVSAANYNINNGVGQPAFAALLSDRRSVSLGLSAPLANGTYTLQISAAKDLLGNASATQTADFQFIKIDAAVEFDILINEIMADPRPLRWSAKRGMARTFQPLFQND
ncbi:MAG: AAA family ATPase [Anaerolineae bacterium]|nr:AAA family ATPase [Anaerolineae bacterium]